MIFFLVSFLIVATFSFSIWWQNRDNKETLAHVGDPDWSSPVELTDTAYSGKYDYTIFSENFVTAYLQRDRKSKEETLFLQSHNFKGETLDKKNFITAGSLNNFSLHQIDDDIILFAITGERDSEQSLKYFRINQSFEIVEERVIIDNLSYANGLKSIREKNDFYLAYFADREKSYVIELVKYNLKEDNYKKKTVIDKAEDNSRSLNLRYPDLSLHNNNIVLAFLRQDPGMVFSGSKDKNNQHNIAMQFFDKELNQQSNIKSLTRARFENKYSQPRLISEDNDIHVFFQKYDVKGENLYLQHLKYDLQMDKVSEEKRAGTKTRVSPDYTRKGDKYYFVYREFERASSFLYLDEVDQIDLSGRGDRLFSQFNLSKNPKIFSTEEGEHLLWIENDENQPGLYYSNNIYGRDIGFMEIVGLHSSRKGSSLLSLPIYFLGTPFLSVFRNFHLVFFTGLIVALIYFPAVKFRWEKIKNLFDNIYISFSLTFVILLFLLYFASNISYLFFPKTPDGVYIPYIFASAFVGVMALLTQAVTDDELNPLIAVSGTILWIYWINMANLVIFAPQYFM